jgi:predicted nucleic acid-binding protein
MQVFIDTNVLLSFYTLTQADLSGLGRLAERLKSGELKLIVTDRIVDEFYRNRERCLEGILKSFYAQTFNPQFPQICETYPDVEELRTALKEYERAHHQMVTNISSDIEAKNLLADKTIAALFDCGVRLNSDPDTIERARMRMSVGNPPGKNNSLGDAINWELLLGYVANGEDLVLVSGDKDYSSPFGEDRLSGFLQAEWQQCKGSSIHFYRRISTFLKDWVPDIDLGGLSDRDRDYPIRELANSQSIADVEKWIAKLDNHDEFTALQANQIALAVLNNRRVAWSIDNPQVRTFITDLIDRHHQYFDDATRDRLQSLLGN